MNHRDRYTEHRPIRSSLTPHVGRTPADPDVIKRLADRAFEEAGFICFTREELARMPEYSRRLIESEALRLRRDR